MSSTHAIRDHKANDKPASCCARVFNQLQLLKCHKRSPSCSHAALPLPSQERLDSSLQDQPFEVDNFANLNSGISTGKIQTVLYLAYGSNMCSETFRGARGIRPLSQINVQVPHLRLTFDLPGIPYAEPCFANTEQRVPGLFDVAAPISLQDYHKNRWHKGLVGVVYEVTSTDYAHIIATEGGGSAYNDILVDCYALGEIDTVPALPTSRPFKAHTLFAPMANQVDRGQTLERVIRPDPSYAQPSARYLKLITDGATECRLPTEYQNFLHGIRPYTITSRKQAVGKALFLAVWMPFVTLIFALSKKLQDRRGRAPRWFAQLSALIFSAMWLSYDSAFKDIFGDGERTIGDEAMHYRGDFRHSTRMAGQDRRKDFLV